MSAETKPVITSLTWKSQQLYELKSSSISEASSIPELIYYLKSAFRDKEYSLVEEILIERQLNKDNQLKHMEKICEDLKKGKDEAEVKLKMYVEKFNELERRVMLQEEEAAKKCAVDVAVVQKMVEDLEAAENEEEEEEVVEVNSQGSGAEQLLTGNGSGKSGDEGSGNTAFVSTQMNLVNCPDVQTLHPMPSACGYAQVNSNVSNIEKKRCRSEEADPLPINLACENRAPIVDLSACEAEVCVKSNVDTVSGRAGSSAVVHISDSDDENAKACASKSNGVGRNVTFPHQIKEEDVKETSLSKRKRSLSDIDNGDGGSFGKQKTGSIQELNRDGKLFVAHDNSHKTMFVRRCDDKDGGKFYSQLSSIRSDLYKFDGISDDSSSDSENDPLSDKSINMFIQKITKRRMFSSEDDLRSSFEKDPELCMNAVCALYRKYISPNISSKGLYFTASQVLSQSDKISIAALGEFLIDGHPENKLRKAVEEVRPKDQAECKRLATKYCHQLYQIYVSKEDLLFCLISKF